jgi:arylsulfatase A-like enzyme
MARKGKWKIVSKYPGGWELHDMERDRTEMHDLAAEQPEKVQEMKALCEAWARRADV